MTDLGQSAVSPGEAPVVSPGGAAPEPIAYEPRPRAVLTGVVCLIVASAILLGGLLLDVRVEQIGIGPRTWPIMLGGLGVLLSLALIIQGLRGRTPAGDSQPATRPGYLRVSITVAGTALGLFLWSAGVPYLIWMALLMCGLLVTYGIRGWKSLILVPAVVLAIVFVVFDLLLKVAL